MCVQVVFSSLCPRAGFSQRKQVFLRAPKANTLKIQIPLECNGPFYACPQLNKNVAKSIFRGPPATKSGVSAFAWYYVIGLLS